MPPEYSVYWQTDSGKYGEVDCGNDYMRAQNLADTYSRDDTFITVTIIVHVEYSIGVK